MGPNSLFFYLSLAPPSSLLVTLSKSYSFSGFSDFANLFVVQSNDPRREQGDVIESSGEPEIKRKGGGGWDVVSCAVRGIPSGI